MSFVKEIDSKGKTYIIEGEKKPGHVFSVKRFICKIQQQQTDKETQEVADMVLAALSKNEKRA